MVKKLRKSLDEIVTGCAFTGAVSFLGAAFGGAAHTLASLARYASGSGAEYALDAADIGLACGGGAIGTGIFAGLCLLGMYSSGKSRAKKAEEDARNAEKSRLYFERMRNARKSASSGEMRIAEPGSPGLLDSDYYEPEETEYPPDIVTSQFSATGSTGIDLANGSAVRLW